jgi:hypothetical protein
MPPVETTSLDTQARKAPYYLNPLENLEDLLYYICGALKSEPAKTENGLGLLAGTFEARFERTVEGARIAEALDIRKAWDPSKVEHLVCSLEYTESKKWEAALKDQMKRDPSADRFYKNLSETKGRNRYLNYEMFVDSIHCMQWMGCELSYETSNLGRGLRTLAKLKIIPEDTIVEGDATLFQALYREMETRAELLLASQFGRDRAKWKRALQRRFVDIPVGFKKKFASASPPALLRAYIGGLCKIYAMDKSG